MANRLMLELVVIHLPGMLLFLSVMKSRNMADSSLLQLLLPFYGLLLLLPCFRLIEARPQLVGLRHPESNFGLNFGNRRTSPRPSNENPPPMLRQLQPSRHSAKPGNVLVHLDKNHDIQRLQYVLQDGRLATLYQRHPQHPENSRTPLEVHNSQLVRREESASSPPTPPSAAGKGSQQQAPVHIDHDQTIDILNSKLQGVSQLVGDHLTVEIPNHSVHGEARNQSEGASEDEKLDIIATIAVDALQSGVQTGVRIGGDKLRKAGIVLDKIKSKVSQKLHDLPSLLEAKLKPKSSLGKVYVDQLSNRVQVVEEKPTIREPAKAEAPPSTPEARQYSDPNQQYQLSKQQLIVD